VWSRFSDSKESLLIKNKLNFYLAFVIDNVYNYARLFCIASGSVRTLTDKSSIDFKKFFKKEQLF
jgi:hypothetical protein